jgi:methyltransferase (TIGR00027 family)
MTDASPSRTAAGVAWLRAAHQILDDPPRILDDPGIVALLGPAAVERLRAERARAQTPGARALRAHVVLRSRFAEDRLALAVARGVRQYIVLGAGYDTFIVRQPAWARKLRVVEVDRPVTQAEKRARLAAAGIDDADNVEFAGVDFEHETLADGLARHGIRLDVPSFFSWLGVTMYLSEPAIDAVLGTVAGCPAGSEIVFTFAQPRGAGGAVERVASSGPTLAERAASVGEPWLTYFEPESLERKLRGFGFGSVEFLTPEEAAVRYFAGRSDGLPPPRRTTIVSAVR